MKILIATNYKGSWPYVYQFVKHLIKLGCYVDILDTNTFNVIDLRNGNNKSIISKNIIKIIDYLRSSKIYNTFLLSGKIRRYINFWVDVLILKSYFNSLQIIYDIFNIQYVTAVYVPLLKNIKKISHKTIAVIWGSDFYRIDAKQHLKLQKLFDKIDSICSTKPVLIDVLKKYNRFHFKVYPLVLGIDSVDRLYNKLFDFNKAEVTFKLGLPTNKLFVTIGYNGYQEQQHLLIIDTLKKLKSDLLDKLFIIIPLTYGLNKEYLYKLKNSLENSKINYKLYDKYLSDNEVDSIRLVTDISIQMQTNDAFSSSVREHLLAKNIVIVGDWLPYDVYNELNVVYIKANFKVLGAILKKVIIDFEKYKIDCNDNSSKILNISSWNHLAPKWVEYFNRVLCAE